MFLILNIISITLYVLAFLISGRIDVVLPLNIIGVIFLLLVVPYNISVILNKRFKSPIDNYLYFLVLFFFLYTPIYYFVNQIIGLSIKPTYILAINIVIFGLAYFTQQLRHNKQASLSYTFKDVKWKQIVKKHYLLIIALALYATIHSVNFYFYKFIPEWDGYADLVKIEESLETDSIVSTYRGFFYSASTLISSFSQASPYTFFSFWMIALQSTLVIILYRLLALYKIKDKLIAFSVLASAVAVPVINMEVDMVRPQNVVIIFYPVYFYFLYRALTKKESLSWLISSLIPIIGLNYHEFFVFIFIVHIGWIVWYIFKRFFIHAESTQDKSIFALSTILLISLFFNFKNQIPVLNYVVIVFTDILTNIITVALDTSNWRWWFLGQYQTDGEQLQMGWPGLTGAIQYYSYYLSPAVFVILGLFFISWRKQRLYRNALILSLLPIIFIFFSFSEILPRINFYLLPERFWLFTTMLLILSAVPIWAAINKEYKPITIKILSSTLLITTLIGICGSWYIAYNKGSLTTINEYQTSQWIKENTPKDSIFISQAANGPMIRYFSRRNLIVPKKEFFLENEIIQYDVGSQITLLEKQLATEKNLITIKFQDLEKANYESLENFIGYLVASNEKIDSLKKDIAILNARQNDAKQYILYSHDKFNSLYSKRDWWLKANFHGANLEKFNNAYPLVYSKNNIYIWEIK